MRYLDVIILSTKHSHNFHIFCLGYKKLLKTYSWHPLPLRQICILRLFLLYEWRSAWSVGETCPWSLACRTCRTSCWTEPRWRISWKREDNQYQKRKVKLTIIYSWHTQSILLIDDAILDARRTVLLSGISNHRFVRDNNLPWVRVQPTNMLREPRWPTREWTGMLWSQRRLPGWRGKPLFRPGPGMKFSTGSLFLETYIFITL